MKKRLLLSLASACVVSVALVFAITDLENIYLNIYNFAVFMFLYLSGTVGLTAIVYLFFLVRKKKRTKEEMKESVYKSSLIMVLFLIAMGIYFYDSSVPREYEGDEYVYQYEQPKDLHDGLVTDDIGNTNFSPDTLKNIVKKIVEERNYKGITSFLLLHKNKLIVEEYFYDVKHNTPHDIRSATKSITALLTGIAVDKGFIKSEDEKISKFFPEYFNEKDSVSLKSQITVKDLLDMNSCLDCNDWDRNSPGQENKIYRTRDWVETVLKLGELKRDSTARYCTGGVIVLGEIIAKTSGMKTDEFAKKYLFEPLGINNLNWQYMPSGQTDTGGHLNITSRDFVKLGALILNNGIWNNEQIISVDWLKKIKQNNIVIRGYRYYLFIIPD
ncbi:MAG: serine hydrolase domain-containing protein, partial [Rhodothermaceae bacterium]